MRTLLTQSGARAGIMSPVESRRRKALAPEGKGSGMALQMVRLSEVCRAAKEGQCELTVAERMARKGPFSYYADNCQSFDIDDWLVEAQGAVLVPAYGQVVSSLGYVMARKEEGRFSFGRAVHALVPFDPADTDYIYQVITHSPQVAHQVSGTPQLRQISEVALLASRIPWPCRATRDSFVAMVDDDEAESRRLAALPAQLMAEGDEAFARIVAASAPGETVALEGLVGWREGTGVPYQARGADKPVRVEGTRSNLGRCDEVLAAGPAVLVGAQGSAMVARYIPEESHPLADVLYACQGDAQVDLGVLFFALRAAGLHEGVARGQGVTREAFAQLRVCVGTPEAQAAFAPVAAGVFERLLACERDAHKLERDHAARLAEFFGRGSVWGNGSCEGCESAVGDLPEPPAAPAETPAPSANAAALERLAALGPLQPLAAEGIRLLADPADVAWELAPLAVVRACATPSQWAYVAASAGPYAAPAYANLVAALDAVMGELAESNDLLSFLPQLSYATSLLSLETLAGWVGALSEVSPDDTTGGLVRAALQLDASLEVLPQAVRGVFETAVRACARSLGDALECAYVPCSGGEGVPDQFAREFPQVTLRTQVQEFSHILADMLVRAAQLKDGAQESGGMGAAPGSALAHDEFPDWKAQLVCAVLPEEEGPWHEGVVDAGDPRWSALGVPPRNKAVFAWIQQALFHLDEGGLCALLVPNGALHSQAGSELALRTRLAAQGRVSAVVSLPARIFPNARPAMSLLVLGDAREGRRTLMVDALDCAVAAQGSCPREVPTQVAERVEAALRAWIAGEDVPDEQGFCRTVSATDIEAAGQVLTPWTFVG